MIWLLACGAAPEADRASYLASADGDVAACDRIGDAALRDDCRLQVAAHHGRLGDRARAESACDGIREGAWRDECWFLAADELALLGDDALAWCARAGRWESHCRGHALGRAARAEATWFHVGDEVLLEDRLTELAGFYRPKAGSRQARVMGRDLLTEALADRMDGVFDHERCGQADPVLCAAAYKALSDSAACTDPAAAYPFLPASQHVARDGLNLLCSR